MKTEPLIKEISKADAERRQVLVEALQLAKELMEFCDKNDIGRFEQKDGGDGLLSYIPQKDKR